MNQPFAERDAALPKHLADFQYVNGGLFRHLHHAPRFSRKVVLYCLNVAI
jgi:hypothetical protein